MMIFPQSRTGKWSVGLTVLFLLMIFTFFAFMLLGLVTFDEGHSWDFTVAAAIPIELTAFILSIIAYRKAKDRSVLNYMSFFIGAGVLLFLLLHSLFISD